MPTPPPPVEYQFKKGQSGNPKGKPKGKMISTYLKEYMELKVPKNILKQHNKKGQEIIIKGLNGKDFKGTYGALIAAKMVQKALRGEHRAMTNTLDRTEGKPVQYIEQQSKNYHFHSLPEEDLDSMISKYSEKTQNDK